MRGKGINYDTGFSPGGRLNGFLAETAALVRSRFAGPVSYASGMWEPVDWAPFDIAAVDAYRGAGNAATFGSELRKGLGWEPKLAFQALADLG